MHAVGTLALQIVDGSTPRIGRDEVFRLQPRLVC